MNDRGLSLSLPDMLKGYVLANIRHEADQRAVNEVWKGHVQQLQAAGNDYHIDFFKDWLRARHAALRGGCAEAARGRAGETVGVSFERWGVASPYFLFSIVS